MFVCTERRAQCLLFCRYDNYLDGRDQKPNRNSGMGALGMGFMNGSMDDEDDDDDEPRKPGQAGPLPSKHAALAAATSGREPSPPPQYIASPRPGYAAPIATLNLARPEPAQGGAQRQPQLQINVKQGQGQNPFLHASEHFPPPSPVPSAPHPLQAPMTPITPVFARPQKAQDITFADEKPIMRGEKEETMLPRRGERGDEFWRRFSVIAHTENRKSGRSVVF